MMMLVKARVLALSKYSEACTNSHVISWSLNLIVTQEHPTVVSGGIWAFHFGYDNSAFPSMERAAQLIHNSGKSEHLCFIIFSL